MALYKCLPDVYGITRHVCGRRVDDFGTRSTNVFNSVLLAKFAKLFIPKHFLFYSIPMPWY